MIKALFFDIDGTLVSFKTHEIPQSAIEAIAQARSNGVKVYICTGRPFQYINNLGSMEHDGIICATGTMCLDSKNELISIHSLPNEDVRALIGYLDSHDMPFVAIGREKLYSRGQDSPKVVEIMNYLNLKVPSSLPLEDAANDDILQLIGFFDREEEVELMRDILPHCVAMRWHEAFADVIVDGVSKATGIDEVLSHLGLGLDEAMAFGDGGNDILMLRHVPCSVAMGNASDEVKASASYVTTDVDDDGVANALRHFGVIR